MRRLTSIVFLALTLSLSTAATVLAQDGGEAPKPEHYELFAILINGAGVWLAIRGLRRVMPVLRPYLPIFAALAGPVIAWLTGFLSTLLGYPIDLSAIAAILAGMGATWSDQAVRKAVRG